MIEQSSNQIQFNKQKLATEYSFFLFINSGSGGGLGMKLISQEIEKIQFVLQIRQQQEPKQCSTYFYNMRDVKQRNKGFNNLHQIIQANNNKNAKQNKCYAIVCGGDGTIMWVVTEMIKNNIQVLKVPIGIIPLGTGNDFSRELGWGIQKTMLLQNNYRSLKKLIKIWINADEEYFDIWDVQAEIYDNGKFEKVENSENKLIEGKTIKRTFCNYFSFGIDGKIGYSFDMHRAKSRLGNLAMYGIMGMAKTLTKTKTIDELIESMEIADSNYQQTSIEKLYRPSSLQQKKQNQEQSTNMVQSNKTMGTSVFRSKIKKSEIKNKQSQDQGSQFFKDGYCNILMLNVNSFTGGVKDIWEKAKPGFFEQQKKQQYTDVSTGDGKIEVVSFPSSIAIAMERGIGGFSRKVTQSRGPFVFNFRKYENEPKHRTYLQIDGQFIRFTHPMRISINHSLLVPKGKIKVIRKNPKYEPYMPN